MKTYRTIAGWTLGFIPTWGGMSLVILILLSSCAGVKPQGCGEKDKAWSANLALWKSKAIGDYDVVVERYRNPMYGHVPFLIKVRNGKNISMEPARENRGSELTDGYESVATVEQMFETMKKACERGDNVVATFDSQLGVPTYFGFSNIADPPDKADGFKLEKLTPFAK